MKILALVGFIVLGILFWGTLIFFAVKLVSGWHGIGYDYQITSPQAIADSLSKFKAVEFDRRDITEGRFQMWPRRGDYVEMAAVFTNNIRVVRDTKKDYDAEKAEIVIRSTCAFAAEMPVSSSLKLWHRDKFITIPAHYTIEFVGYVNCQDAQRLADAGVGTEARIKGVVYSIITQRVFIPHDYDQGMDPKNNGGLEVRILILLHRVDDIRFEH